MVLLNVWYAVHVGWYVAQQILVYMDCPSCCHINNVTSPNQQMSLDKSRPTKVNVSLNVNQKRCIHRKEKKKHFVDSRVDFKF